MTDSAGSGPDPLDPADEPGHRVRRRRRAASRPAGPPTAERDRPGEARDQAADAAAGETIAPEPTEPVAALDPVEKSDRRREKKRRNRTERLAAEAAATAAAAPQSPARSRRPQSERGMHTLEGNRATQVPSTEAMRARDWAAPGPADLAAAEAELVIVRRHYRPPEPLPKKQTTGQDPRSGSGPAGEHPRSRD